MNRNKNTKQSFGSRLKAHRLRYLLTLQDIADLVGMTAAGVWKIENEKTKPSELSIARIQDKIQEMR